MTSTPSNGWPGPCSLILVASWRSGHDIAPVGSQEVNFLHTELNQHRDRCIDSKFDSCANDSSKAGNKELGGSSN